MVNYCLTNNLITFSGNLVSLEEKKKTFQRYENGEGFKTARSHVRLFVSKYYFSLFWVNLEDCIFRWRKMWVGILTNILNKIKYPNDCSERTSMNFNKFSYIWIYTAFLLMRCISVTSVSQTIPNHSISDFNIKVFLIQVCVQQGRDQTKWGNRGGGRSLAIKKIMMLFSIDDGSKGNFGEKQDFVAK